jgi:SAM-dependent methyltransferase
VGYLQSEQEPDVKGKEALEVLLRDYKFNTVIDVGCGKGSHAQAFRDARKEVTPVDHTGSIEGQVKELYQNVTLPDQYDCVWACHVLEHQLNSHDFLLKIHSDLKEGGILCITVPPMKKNIVGGHVSLWNGGLLMYHLVLAGFDCTDIRIKRYGYNISIILRKKSITVPGTLHYDKGDLEKLSKFFPSIVKQGFNGDIHDHNWDDWKGEVKADNKTFLWTSSFSNSGPTEAIRTGGWAVAQEDRRGKVRRVDDVRRAVESSAKPDLLLMHNFIVNRVEMKELALSSGIDVVHGEDGFLPHYTALHFDPSGFCWESSLTSMQFRDCTDKQYEVAAQHIEDMREDYKTDLHTSKPFVLFPLQLLSDRVNTYSLNIKENWLVLLEHARHILPEEFDLVVRPHPRGGAYKDESEWAEITRGVIWRSNKQASLVDELHACSGVIGSNSTVISEARLLYNKPVWAYGPSWYTNHTALVYPLQHTMENYMLPWADELIDGVRKSEYLDRYKHWYVAQLMARQFGGRTVKDVKTFQQWLLRRTHNSFKQHGEDIFSLEGIHGVGTTTKVKERPPTKSRVSLPRPPKSRVSLPRPPKARRNDRTAPVKSSRSLRR